MVRTNKKDFQLDESLVKLTRRFVREDSIVAVLSSKFHRTDATRFIHAPGYFNLLRSLKHNPSRTARKNTNVTETDPPSHRTLRQPAPLETPPCWRVIARTRCREPATTPSYRTPVGPVPLARASYPAEAVWPSRCGWSSRRLSGECNSIARYGGKEGKRNGDERREAERDGGRKAVSVSITQAACRFVRRCFTWALSIDAAAYYVFSRAAM